jgi:hypothetical protein
MTEMLALVWEREWIEELRTASRPGAPKRILPVTTETMTIKLGKPP